ncbi:homeobox protein CDX-2 isoform X1 [Pezoporus wallicus]|uniref:homeobox protein CDX-2 isoform X1 n=1 Tax=Pezoporus wallicus TaxID=35540 RepID=UPI002550C318|nr:homeobox protein CDX-2 isoform X1 [Pezoporus wallicus]XP_061314166.1 homeobox protein CDX-2 isoform X1 [Pezoporus flaviventris]
MYVSYLLEKDGPMYPGPVRHSGGLNLAAQNFVGAPQYADYGGYHVNLDSAQSPGPAWPAPYAAPLRDDWGAYGQGAPPAAAAVHGLNGGSPAAAMAYNPADYHHHHPHAHHHAGPAPHCSAGVMQPLNAANNAAAAAVPEPLSPGGQRRGLCEWMRKPAQPPLSSQGENLVPEQAGEGEEDQQEEAAADAARRSRAPQPRRPSAGSLSGSGRRRSGPRRPAVTAAGDSGTGTAAGGHGSAGAGPGWGARWEPPPPSPCTTAPSGAGSVYRCTVYVSRPPGEAWPSLY